MSTERTTNFQHNQLNTKQDHAIYMALANHVPTCDRHTVVEGLNLLMGDNLASILDNWISSYNTYTVYKQTIKQKPAEIQFHSKRTPHHHKPSDHINMNSTIAGSVTFELPSCSIFFVVFFPQNVISHLQMKNTLWRLICFLKDCNYLPLQRNFLNIIFVLFFFNK